MTPIKIEPNSGVKKIIFKINFHLPWAILGFYLSFLGHSFFTKEFWIIMGIIFVGIFTEKFINED